MLKIRLQGTAKDIRWFRKFLQRQSGIRVLGVSDMFANKGTNRYYRSYAEVEKEERQE